MKSRKDQIKHLTATDGKQSVSRIRHVAEYNWFEYIDFNDANIKNMTKTEMLELLKILNKQMIDSLENWDGG